MKTIIKSLLFLSVLLQQVNAQADIRLYPSRLFFYQQEGLQQQKTVHLVNKSAKKVICLAEMLDWKRDSTGNKIYYPIGTLPTSGSSIMTVSQNTISLEPGEDKEITISMNMKNGETTFKNSMLFFTQVDTDTLQKGLKILIQLGVHLYSVPQKYVDKIIIVSNAIIKDTGGGPNLCFDIANTTRAIIDTEIKAEILNEEGEKQEESQKMHISSMPDDSFRVTIPFNKTSKLKNGSKIIVYIDNGFEHPLQMVEIPITSQNSDTNSFIGDYR